MSIPHFQPYFVGHFWDGQDWNYLPMTHREVERSVIANIRILDTFRVPPRSGALVISSHDNWVMAIPLEEALMRSRQIIFNADNSPFEAGRIEAFLRRFNPPMVFGVSTQVLQGLENTGHDPRQLLAGRTVWCVDREAWQQLADVETLRLRQWRQIGPASAMECAAGAGLHVDTQEWLLEQDQGEIVITSRMNRYPELLRTRTGLRGHIDHSCCACGIAHPRIILAD
jgi:hypothetical protein